MFFRTSCSGIQQLSQRGRKAFGCFALLGCLLLLGSHAAADPTQKKATDGHPACIEVTTTARYIIGYDHLVHVKNGCDKTAACEVSTNVNPDAQQVTITAGQTATVITFRGSPARTFEPHVACTLEN